MGSSLFLHYGPGANAEVEKALLSESLPSVEFWNQPKFKASKQPFADLVQACGQQAMSMGPNKKLIGHSFGCDLIASMMELKTTSIEQVVLVSPIRSIPIAFQRLASVLGKNQSSHELTIALENSLLSNCEETFWKLVGPVASHPFYSSAFWHQPKAQQRFEAFASKAAAFDGAEWQAVIQDYLFVSGPTDWQILKNRPVLAVFGEEDPYLDKTEIPYWRKLLGHDQVVVIKNCGHFPHLEEESRFVTVLNEWFY